MAVIEFIPTKHFLRSSDIEAIKCDMSVEHELGHSNGNIVIGCDEAGRGPLAGPVVAAAVYIPTGVNAEHYNDSKKLSDTKRTELFNDIIKNCVCAIASATAKQIDASNIRAASLNAMAYAAKRLPITVDAALIDGNAAPQKLPFASFAMIKGDARSSSIAAASILAKTLRDRQMILADEIWPQYGFSQHKGYPTKQHFQALEKYGPCPIHRLSFAPVAKCLGQ